MENKDDIQKELNELAPRLARLKKDNPFKTPDYYFQDLTDKVLDKVKNEQVPWTERIETSLNRIFSRIFQPRYALTFATCLVLLAISIGFLRDRETVADPVQFSQISSDEINAYLVNADLDDDELFVLTGTKAPGSTENFIPANMSNEELNDYLNDNIDNQTIEEEYL